MTHAEAFAKLCQVITRLRAPDGCPWDREQTPQSLRADLIEETFECIEAINEDDPEHIKEELGDIILNAAMIAAIFEERGVFSVAQVLEDNAEKLIRRHSHVFGEEKAQNSQEALANWDKEKAREKGRGGASLLDGVSKGIPPLDRAWELQKKAAKAGFDWPDLAGVIEKFQEELEEVKAAEAAGSTKATEATFVDLEDELGDLLFMGVNLCRYLGIAPSVALHRANLKFIKRFSYMEERMKEKGQALNAQNLALMDSYWNEAKTRP
ncbi:MAG: nucleoside triphosphate pyrophosphohydrolase [Treponema sp.]|nr:nucleoside triphosphate pyrophosphohydrolase [Treponema sp.]